MRVRHRRLAIIALVLIAGVSGIALSVFLTKNDARDASAAVCACGTDTPTETASETATETPI